jgi:hypothetical protein
VKSEYLRNAEADLAEAGTWLDQVRAHPELEREVANLASAVGFLRRALDEMLKHLAASERG